MKLNSQLVRSGSLAIIALAALAGCASGKNPGHETPATTTSPSAPMSSGAGMSPPSTPSPLPVLGSSDSDPEQNQHEPAELMNTSGMTMQVNAIKRDSSGVVTLTWSIINHTDHDLDVWNRLWDETNSYRPDSISDVQLIDESKRVIFHPLMDTDMVCYCSRAGGINNNLKSNTKSFYIDMFKPDPDTKNVDIRAWGFKSVKNIPIT